MLRHRWDISPKKAIELQRSLARKVISQPLDHDILTVAGTDCAFLDDGRRIIAAAVLCGVKSMKVIDSATVVQPCGFPYVPGLLSFREAPAVIAAVKKLRYMPDLLMCDGQGLAHPRGLGLASHVGLWLDIPTIGVAKSLLCGEYRRPGRTRGCCRRLMYDGKVIGAVLVTRDNVKPLFISVGHRITLAEAVRWTLRAGRGVRLPEPTRLAHQLVSSLKR